MFSDYFEIRTKGLPEDAHFILGKLFTRIHGALRSEKLNIGLGFPELKSCSPGCTLRCFGKPEDLTQLRSNSGIAHLEQQGMIFISPIKTVPAGAEPIAYRRERRTEKHLSGFKKRQLRRQKRRRASTQKLPESNFKVSQGSAEQPKKRPAYLLLERNGQQLPIHIEPIRLKIDPDICQFNSYGLAQKIGDQYAAVPIF